MAVFLGGELEHRLVVPGLAAVADPHRVDCIAIWRVIIPFARWFTTQYVFTSRRIIIRRGMVTKQGRDMPLAKVNNVSFNVGIMGRMLNYGTLEIESASDDGDMYIQDVPDVEQIQRLGLRIARTRRFTSARRRRG